MAVYAIEMVGSGKKNEIKNCEICNKMQQTQ